MESVRNVYFCVIFPVAEELKEAKSNSTEDEEEEQESDEDAIREAVKAQKNSKKKATKMKMKMKRKRKIPGPDQAALLAPFQTNQVIGRPIKSGNFRALF